MTTKSIPISFQYPATEFNSNIFLTSMVNSSYDIDNELLLRELGMSNQQAIAFVMPEFEQEPYMDMLIYKDGIMIGV